MDLIIDVAKENGWWNEEKSISDRTGHLDHGDHGMRGGRLRALARIVRQHNTQPVRANHARRIRTARD